MMIAVELDEDEVLKIEKRRGKRMKNEAS